LAAATSTATAGDTVYLASGSYGQLFVANSGTAAAPLTFKADECSTPIIESAVSTDEAQTAGVSSEKGEYLVFEGLVVRGWSTGFGNHWAGGTDSTEVSNGHWKIKNCISYSNGRTGFTFFSGPSYELTNSIAAHNGSSTAHSWSSGVTLFEATGTNLVQGVVSFENTDEERHTDGSGFIVDEGSNGATFINNIAFGNSGSCFRLTKSSGTTFVNNTCYHNSQFGSQATGPSNPGEIYFTNGGVTIQNVNFKNNVIVGTGMAPAGATPIQNMPTSGWANNVVTTNAANLFKGADGSNPDFTPASNATNLIGKGGTGTGVPTTDIGLDPKCIVKRAPKMFGTVAALSRWQYDIDVDYVVSKGGVAKCFNGGARSGTPDIGAYNSGTIATAPICTPSVNGTGGTTGGGGASGGGASGAAGANGGGLGGGSATGGSGGHVAAGGNGGSGSGGNATGGSVATGGTSTGGAASGGTGGGSSTATGGRSPGSTGGSVDNTPADNDGGGCSCRMASGEAAWPAAAWLLGLVVIALQRRRRRRMR